ncbi:golgin subfamily A member 5 [Dermatophagoides farinae]|uniref:Golgin sub A member 5 n=1 Tax=Dermatophagoides farinae TaxID=6954 RepID=A0A922HWS9_DERFA|nr:Golgin sub A member 5 [Dermatophagoides farinae]
MSWLTEIAGKAENFLNAVDKSAATALTNVNHKNVRKHSFNKSDTTNDHNGSLHLLDTEYIDTPDIMSLRTSTSTNSLLSENGNSRKGEHTRTSSYDSIGSRNSKSHDDDRLMEYLNKDNNIPEEEWQSLNNSNHDESSNDNNKLKTKREILTRDVKELDSLNKKILELNGAFKKQKLKAQNYYNQNMANEKLIKELNSKEHDLIASISAKDSQIAALKVQTEQLLVEIQEKEEKYKELKHLHQQIRHELQNKSENNELTINLQREIESLKQSLEFEKAESKRIQDSSNQQIIRLEDNQRSLIEELDNYRRQLNEQKSNRTELEMINNSLRKKCETIEKEFEQFKCKVQKTLKDKDDLMETSRSNKTNDDDGDHDHHDDGQMKILHEQCNTLMNELIELRSRYDQMKSMLDKDENETIPRQTAEIQTLKDQMEEEKKINSNLQNEIDQLSRDRKSYQDDLNQIKSSLSARITERDDEIDKLRRQLILKQQRTTTNHHLVQMDDDQSSFMMNTSITNEWEQRLKSLTENLITKQSMIEQLSSTNHSLKLQLERSEQKLHELVMNNGQLKNDVAIGIYHSPSFTNLIKHRITGGNNDSVQSLIHDDPNDGQVTRKVKRAYTAIDTFSIRLGNFLRMYPSARAAFLVYIIILHVWVAFVLMYYEPEIHGSDFNAK